MTKRRESINSPSISAVVLPTSGIARLILDLFEPLARRGLAHERVMDFPLRQHHIADATGLTAVHVSKVLSEFRRASLIKINDRSLTILRLTELRHIANLR